MFNLKPPIWLDANVLINLDRWRHKPNFAVPKAAYEAELIRLKADGHELLLTPQAKREVLFGGKNHMPRDTLRMHQMVTRFGIKIDTMGSQVPRKEIDDWIKLGMKHGLSKEDATLVAEVKASAQARNVQNPMLFTRDAGGTLQAIRNRGVLGVEFKAPVVNPTPPPPPPAPPKLQQPPPPATPRVTPPVRTPPTGVRTTSIESITSRLGRLRAAARGSLPLRIVGSIAANVIFALIGAYLQSRANRKQIESDLERIEKEVQAILAKKEALDLIGKAQLLANADEKVYAVFGIEFHHGEARGPYVFNKRYDYPTDAEISAWVAPEGVQVLALSEFQKRLRGGKLTEKRNGMVIIETYYEFMEVAVYSAEEVNAFHDLEDRYFSLKNRWMLEPYNQELTGELAEAKKALLESFGDHVSFPY